MALSEDQMLEYVKTASGLMGFKLELPQMERVAFHLKLASMIFQNLEGKNFAVHDEPAQVYCPAPFPSRASATPSLTAPAS